MIYMDINESMIDEYKGYYVLALHGKNLDYNN